MLRRQIKGWPAGDYAGMTCAACHQGLLKYKGKLIRIEGGISNTFNFQGLASGISEALLKNLTDRGKIRPLGGADRSNNSGCEGQVAQAN